MIFQFKEDFLIVKKNMSHFVLNYEQSGIIKLHKPKGNKMKYITLIAAILLIINTSTPSKSVPGGESSNTNCNGVGNPNSPCIPSTGTGNNGGGNSGGTPNTNNSQSNILTNTLDVYSQSAAESISKSSSLSSVVSNTTGGNATSSSGGNTLSSNQQQANTNTSSGNTTNINESNITKFPQQAPPLISTQITPVNNNGFNGGFTTPFGGAVVGVTRVDGSAKALNFAQAGLINEQKTDQLIKNTDKACDLVSEEECKQLKTIMLRKMGIAKKK